jgi:hypothetical protein
LRHDVVDLVSVGVNPDVPGLDSSLRARTRLVSDDDHFAGLFANSDSSLESESVFSESGESLGVLVCDQLMPEPATC